MSECIQVFALASAGYWAVNDPTLNRERLLTWDKGQPLGLGPSFGAFALAHHAVMREISADPREYVLLGDDIVIKQPRVAAKYMEYMQESLGCPVSMSKTLESDQVAEFAGKVITSSAVFHPYKWRETSDRNFLDLVRNMGPNYIKLLQRRQRDVVTKIAEVPEWAGGLGWNPKGKPLEDRLEQNHPLVCRYYNDALDLTVRPLPAINVVKQELEFAIRLGITQSVQTAQGPEIQTGDTRPGCRNLSDNTQESLHNTRENIIRTVSPKVEMTPLDLIPSGYKVTHKDPDPRGPTTLTNLENLLRDYKIKESPQPVVIPEAEDITPSEPPSEDLGKPTSRKIRR
jgi:hypothetical protein